MSDKKTTYMELFFGLKEPVCDENGLYDGCIAPAEHARILYWLSLLGLVSGIIGIWRGYTWLGLAVCIGSIFAQMYWSRPTYSWRRMLDIMWVQGLIWVHLWVALQSPVWITYCIIQIIGAIAYGISWYCISVGELWASTISHVFLHLCANVSLCILYLS
jgi:hypothetical protein